MPIDDEAIAQFITLGARNTKARPYFLSRVLVWWQPTEAPSLTTFQLNHSEVNAAARRPDTKQHQQDGYHVSP